MILLLLKQFKNIKEFIYNNNMYSFASVYTLKTFFFLLFESYIKLEQ